MNSDKSSTTSKLGRRELIEYDETTILGLLKEGNNNNNNMQASELYDKMNKDADTGTNCSSISNKEDIRIDSIQCEKDVFKKPVISMNNSGTKSQLLRDNNKEHYPKETYQAEKDECTITNKGDHEELTVNVKLTDEDAKSQDKVLKSCETLREPIKQLPYKEPYWSGIPPESSGYYLEVVKNGVITNYIKLIDQPYTVFGRLDHCHIVLEHPSISRYHAVLQYCISPDENYEKGFYIYDLESTHGTYINKQRLKSKVYCPVRVGHMLKFGGSSRLYILQGPETDKDAESELTVTELKEQKRQQELDKMKKEKEKTEEEDGGIDWGLGEDADEEDIDAENPFALSTENEELYLNDPKKTLRGWFEREGYELEYNVEEKGIAYFSCRVELPIDSVTGEPVFAEASVKGKKKEAVLACALEACRILDRHGMLRQSHHEGRKRKQKHWEEEDFYESDEDTFLDRTGTIEKKREMRKKMIKKEQVVETYDSLLHKLESVQKEVQSIQDRLQKKNETELLDTCSGQDSLDAFMFSLQDNFTDKRTKSKLQLRLSQLRQEEKKLQNLVNAVRPASLPPLLLPQAKHTTKHEIGKTVLPITGSMKRNVGGKHKLMAMARSKEKRDVPVLNDGPEIEEEEEEEDDEDKEPICKKMLPVHGNKPKVSECNPELENEKAKEAVKSQPVTIPCETEKDQTRTDKRRILGPQLPPSCSTVSDIHFKTPDHPTGKNQGSPVQEKYVYDENDPNYSIWVPPSDQTGDGKTHLNAKFGY